jgi:anti-anti-sigma factor
MIIQAAHALRLEGEIDMGNAEELSTALAEAISADGGRVEVDMSAVTFIDSAGIHALVSAALTLDPAGRMVVLDPPAQVLRVLRIVGMDGISQIEFKVS